MPQDSAGNKGSHGETTKTVGCDAYPCLLVELDAVSVKGRWQKHASDSMPISHPVSAYLNRPAAFKFTISMREQIDARSGTGATYKCPSNLSLPLKVFTHSRSSKPVLGGIYP